MDNRLREIIIKEGNKWYNHHTDPEKKAYWLAFANSATRFDWDSIPYWFQFAAIDEDGSAHGFEIEPHISDGEWRGMGRYLLLDVKLEEGEDWTTTLERRP